MLTKCHKPRGQSDFSSIIQERKLISRERRQSGGAQIQAEGSPVPAAPLNALLWEYRRGKVLHREDPAWVKAEGGKERERICVQVCVCAPERVCVLRKGVTGFLRESRIQGQAAGGPYSPADT